MKGTDIYAWGAVILAIAFVVALIYAALTGMISGFVAAVVCICLVIFIAYLIASCILGTYYMFKKKDEVHPGSSMTLDDVKEVDREMEKK